ncbi:hypothetical protein [Pectobacterium carotovorum]|uniref:hypothetical protein n=1 Tax=Pectobacterium carotovorum TaxID=554 RepID=UPI0010FD5A76|nr:hypothetical protein [Pectobacterium carotovorum]KAA3667215.1 hypothetical protein FEV48_11915 [Pectobacterium carotovorum subsp. carotovorum]
MKTTRLKTKKIKISLTGEIDLKDIIGEINLTEKENQEVEYEKYTWTSIFIEFVLPIILIFILFLGSKALEIKPYTVIILIPSYYAWFFYRITKKLSPYNINYLRKLTDMITVLSALITATLVVFDILGTPLSSVMENKLIRFALFFILEIFATFASIKLFFSMKDFNDERKNNKI